MIPLQNWNSNRQTEYLQHCTFDDTYWGIETHTIQARYHSPNTFWWYLLRNWNNRKLSSTKAGRLYFWWYLLRNWNWQRHDGLVQQPCFWWYLLRNWNRISQYDTIKNNAQLLMIPIEELKLRSMDGMDATDPLLMIPIEELKLRQSFSLVWRDFLAFDDTYWGIETMLCVWM